MVHELPIVYERLQQMGVTALRQLPGLVLGALVFLLMLLAARWLRHLVQHLNARRFHHNLVLVLGRLTQWGVLTFGVLLATTIAFPSFTPADLVSALGITGIAIGFAFKDIFENFLAGILILATEPFRIDDQIIFDKYEGTVEQIETRATMIRTYDGRKVVIPNAALFKGSFIVNTGGTARRLEHELVPAAGEDIAALKRLLVETLRQTPGTLAAPAPDVLLIDNAGATSLRLRWWVEPPRHGDELTMKDRVIEAVRQTLARRPQARPTAVRS